MTHRMSVLGNADTLIVTVPPVMARQSARLLLPLSALTELLVDLILDRKAVAVPAEAARHVVPGAAGVARHNVL